MTLLAQPPEAVGRMSAPRLRCIGLELGYGGEPVVRGVDLEVCDGAVTVIVGANGCGKSTLLHGMARLLKPVAGHVSLDGDDLHRMRTTEVARRLGLMPQTPVVPEGVTVEELVSRGRHPHRRLLRARSRDDDAAVEEALAATGVAEIADRLVAELSGGQRQRVWIAMALAQQTDILLLDEPTTYLDIAHQVEVLDLLGELYRERGTTIAMVLHDINLAARHADRLVAMRDGRIVAEGASSDVVTQEMIREVFGLQARVVDDPVSGTPLVVPAEVRA